MLFVLFAQLCKNTKELELSLYKCQEKIICLEKAGP